MFFQKNDSNPSNHPRCEKNSYYQAGSICDLVVSLPIVGMSTTEMAANVVNDYSGYIQTCFEWLIRKIKKLLDEPSKATTLSCGARENALEKFHIERFTDTWKETLIQFVKESSPLIV